MHFVPLSAAAHHHGGGLAASQQVLSLVVALFCFVIAAGFLLSLVPDPRRRIGVTCRTKPAGLSRKRSTWRPMPLRRIGPVAAAG